MNGSALECGSALPLSHLRDDERTATEKAVARYRTPKGRTACAMLGVVLTVGVLAGCGTKPIKAANRQKPEPAPIPKAVQGEGISVNWLENLPGGQVRRVMDIKSETGTA